MKARCRKSTFPLQISPRAPLPSTLSAKGSVARFGVRGARAARLAEAGQPTRRLTVSAMRLKEEEVRRFSGGELASTEDGLRLVRAVVGHEAT